MDGWMDTKVTEVGGNLIGVKYETNDDGLRADTGVLIRFVDYPMTRCENNNRR